LGEAIDVMIISTGAGRSIPVAPKRGAALRFRKPPFRGDYLFVDPKLSDRRG